MVIREMLLQWWLDWIEKADIRWEAFKPHGCGQIEWAGWSDRAHWLWMRDGRER